MHILKTDATLKTDIKGEDMIEYNTDKNVVKEYIDSLKSVFGEENISDLLHNNKTADDGIFLSVVMRTQGKRIEMLREALLCLETQTCDNFEVWIMGHNVEENDKANVLGVINDFPEDFRSRIYYDDVIGGTRTTPLNRGFDNANGQYITIFDDDDLVFDNWVETFYDLYKENPGKILHAYAVGQEWKLDNGVPSSIGPFNNVYCRDFIMQNQILYNNCPIMSLAFPAYAYKKLDIKFNEQLNTTEDWDFLMRTAFVCGVCDSKNVTSIYRFWKNVQNSQTLHNEREWIENSKKIQRGFNKFTIPMNVKEISKSASAFSINPLDSDTSDVEIFINNGKGFTADGTALFESGFFGDSIKISIINPEAFGSIHSIRFDPSEIGILKLSNLSFKVFDKNNSEIKTKISFWGSNFVKNGKNYVFLDIDPQIVFKFKKPTEVSLVEIMFKKTKFLGWKTICLASMKLIFVKIIRKLSKIFLNIRGRLGV